jgi:hypothetical protein
MPGARTFAVDCLFDRNVAPYPRLIVKANPLVGLGADIVVDAVAATTWQTLSAGFTATALGAVELWREKRSWGMADSVWWDNLVRS